MLLRINRVSEELRQTHTPLIDEMLYSIDTGRLYLGDGETVGGLAITDLIINDIKDEVGKMFIDGATKGLAYQYDPNSRTVNSEVTDPQKPVLAQDLDLNGHDIFGDGNIKINGYIETTFIAGTDGKSIAIYSGGKPALVLKTVTDGSLEGLPFLSIGASRGTIHNNENTQPGDQLNGVKFTGYVDNDYLMAGAVSAKWNPSANLKEKYPSATVTISAGANGLDYSDATFNGETGTFAAPVLKTGFNKPQTPEEGMIIFDKDTKKFEGWNGTAWVVLG